MTWAVRLGSSICCASPSRPPRCRWASGCSPATDPWPSVAARVRASADPSGLGRSARSPDRAAGRAGRGRRCTGRRVVHRGPAGRYRHAHLARELPAAAVHVRGVRRSRVRRGRSDLRSPGRRRPGASPRGRRGGGRPGRDAHDGALPGIGGRAADRRPGWGVAARGEDADRPRRSRSGAQPPQSRAVDRVRRGSGRRIDLHPIRPVSRRATVRRRPEVHGGAAAATPRPLATAVRLGDLGVIAP